MILVAEDDRTLAETLSYNLEREGYRTEIARTGLEAVTLSRTEHPDLVLLDVMLPEMDGFEVVRVIRSASNMPVIMVTAKDNEVDRVLGLELGADDYVVKPFSLRELMARIRAVLRRSDITAVGAGAESPLIAGTIEVRPSSRSVYRNGLEIHLLPREFDLLLYLMQHAGIVLTRRQLLERVWGPDYLGDERTVDVHVRRLRMKLEIDPSEPSYIHTIYGVGYTFDVRSGRRNDARAL